MCSCPERPKCQWRWCDDYAAWSVLQPAWPPRPARFRFMCEAHWQMYQAPIPGIDRPAHADEFWRPSLTDMMKLASIHAAPASPPMIPAAVRHHRDAKYTPAQLAQVNAMRAIMRAPH